MTALTVLTLLEQQHCLPFGTHQRGRERQASHRGFQLIHSWRHTLSTVCHERLDLDFELFLAVLVLL